MMRNGCFMEVLNHYTVQLKLISHCMLSNWNLNKSFKKGFICKSYKNLKETDKTQL